MNNRYVAFFDMLGFKNAVIRNPQEAWGALCDLRACMDKINQTIIGIPSRQMKIQDRVKTQILSDSIVIFTLSDEPEDLQAIIVLSTQLFLKSLHFCVPLRGGIACGEFFFNTELNLYCGVPYVEAYTIGESAQWSGICLHEVVAQHCFTRALTPFMSKGKQIINQWQVDLKNGCKETRWVIDWPTVGRDNFLTPPPIAVQDYYAAFERLFGLYSLLPAEVKMKYENTIAFINDRLS